MKATSILFFDSKRITVNARKRFNFHYSTMLKQKVSFEQSSPVDYLVPGKPWCRGNIIGLNTASSLRLQPDTEKITPTPRRSSRRRAQLAGIGLEEGAKKTGKVASNSLCGRGNGFIFSNNRHTMGISLEEFTALAAKIHGQSTACGRPCSVFAKSEPDLYFLFSKKACPSKRCVTRLCESIARMVVFPA